MRTRDPNSENQRIMKIFFGDDADNYDSIWRTWPEPYKTIYGRIFKNKYSLIPTEDWKKYNKIRNMFVED